MDIMVKVISTIISLFFLLIVSVAVILLFISL